MQFNIPSDKEETIYEAALNEFAFNGYDKASTNTIVKEAGISKGALFKYFGNKAKLFIYVVDKAINTLDKFILQDTENLSTDMFERIIDLTKIKVTISMKYSRESSIMISAMAVEEKEIKEYINEKINYYYGIMGKLFTEGIDYSKFKEGIDVKKVYEILTYVSEGLSKKYMEMYHGDFQEMLEHLDEMYEDTFNSINLIKDSVYK